MAGRVRLGAGDESITAAESGGEDREGAEGEDEPWMAAPEPAQMEFCPENPPHRRSPDTTCSDEGG
jgi:hypothetical protein